jgi:hypothetical protein
MGLTEASNVYAKVTSASGWLDIITDSVAIGIVNSRTNQIINDKLLMSIADEVPDMGIATLDLMIKSDKSEKHYPLQLVMHAPKLSIENYIIDDTSAGNGDFTADPGETFNLIIRVRNDGSSDASGDLFIGNISPGINLPDQDVTNTMIKAGQLTDIRISLQLSEYVLSGSYLKFTSSLDANPYMLIKNFTFRAGKLRESFEAMSFNIFPWINKSFVPWTVTSVNSYDGAISARSGVVSHNGSTSLVMKSWYPGADTISFSYKVISELNCDHLIFLINGREVLKKSGEIPWTKVSFPVNPGLNQFEWIYKKDNSVSSFPDCAWIDMIDFANSTPVKYIRKDLMVKSIVTPVEKNYIGLGTIKVKLMNVGKDAINGFNLAFRTDKSQIVAQHFNEVIRDSIEVSFKSKADLSHLGKFNIYVYGFNNGDDYLENDTARIEIENDEIYHSMTIYPNPVIEDIKLFLSSINDDNVTLTITGPAGSEIYKTKRAIFRGGNTLIITGLRLFPAVYYLNIRGSTINKTIPFIKSDN